MAARAVWKGIIRWDDASIPVKLYSAVQDRSIHFRLLHKKDKTPVKQVMVNPETEEVVPHEDTKRGYETQKGDIIILDDEELESLEPEPSRDIEIMHFLPRPAIDHRWYDRPYYLGPDGEEESYSALISAMADSGKEGLAHWVMRHKEYYGLLRLHNKYPVLITLRHNKEVVSVSELEPPSSKEITKKEFSMAEQFVNTLSEEFDPAWYHDEFRDKVMDLIKTRARGGKVKPKKYKEKKPEKELSEALKKSLEKAKKERKSA